MVCIISHIEAYYFHVIIIMIIIIIMCANSEKFSFLKMKNCNKHV
jgi:hypothetical protein